MERFPSVLIVEDEALTAMELAECLRDSGCEVIGVADNYLDALCIAADRRPDIAILDYQLRDKVDGLTIAQELNKSAVKIVFLTAYLEEVIPNSRQFGAAYLAKPVLHQEVRETIASMTRQTSGALRAESESRARRGSLERSRASRPASPSS